MLSKLDIDRLHRCVEKINRRETFARGEGATTAMLSLLLGDMMLGDYDNRYIFVSDTTISAGIAAHIMYGELMDAKIPILHASNQLIRLEWNMDVHFMSMDRLCNNTHTLRGLKITRAFIDTSIDRQIYYNRDGKFMEALISIKLRGGDVI